MTREIKFRGMTEEGKWLIGNLLDDGLKNKSYFILPEYADNYDEYEKVIPSTVGQFTGLKDENGVGVYEGDVLKHVDGYGTIITTVKYNHHAFCFESKELGNINPFMIENFSVIGNIHEHPHALLNNE